MTIEASTYEPQTEILDRPARDQDETTADPTREEIALGPKETTLGDICAAALRDVNARFPDRKVTYATDPDFDRRGSGTWDPRRVTYAVTMLLEDAFQRTAPDAPVCLRWREDEDVVVLRVQFARPHQRGDRFVTFFEDGVRPDGAGDTAGTLRLAGARRIMRQHRGNLARIRTFSGTAYVVTLPRSPDVDASDVDADVP